MSIYAADDSEPPRAIEALPGVWRNRRRGPLASLHMNAAAVSSIAERIVQARRLYGADSAYVIGLFAGLEWILDGGEGDAARRQIQDRVLDLEGGKGGAAGPPPAPRAPAEAGGRGRGEGLAENSWIRGVVKWFNNDKGYGFISTAADTDVFVHWRDISSWDRSLTQGDEVEFMVTKTAKGFQAINVMKPVAGGATPAEGADNTAPAGDEGSATAQDDHDTFASTTDVRTRDASADGAAGAAHEPSPDDAPPPAAS